MAAFLSVRVDRRKRRELDRVMQRMVRQYGPNPRTNPLSQILFDAAEPLLDQARAKVPRRTGALAASLRRRKLVTRIATEVGFRPRKAGATSGVTIGQMLGQEFSNRRYPNPVGAITGTFDRLEAAIADDVFRRVSEELAKTWRGRGR